MKQNFQLHYFYGENENAIRTQDTMQLNLVFKEEDEGGGFEIWNKDALFMGYTEEKLPTWEFSRITVKRYNKLIATNEK